MNKKEILAIVKEHMADCVGVSQRDIDDHGERIAFRLDRIMHAEELEKRGLLLENMALKLQLTTIREYRKKEEEILNIC